MPDTDTTASAKLRSRGLAEVAISFWDGHLQSELERLEPLLEKATQYDFEHSTSNADRTATAVEAEIEQLEAALAESEIRFVVRALPREEFEELHNRWPAGDDDVDVDGERLPYNAAGLVPELFARSIIEPAITLDDAKFLYNQWSDVDVGRLLVLAYGINRTYKKVPFTGPATGGTENIGTS